MAPSEMHLITPAAHRLLKFALWCTAALVITGHVLGAQAVLKVSGTTGVAELGRADVAFNFQDGAPGVDGLPFTIGAYTAQGPVNANNVPPALSEKADGMIIEDWPGKLSVSVRWSKGAGLLEANRVYADVTIANKLPEPIGEFVLNLLKLRFPTVIAANDGSPNLRAYNTGSPGILFANYGGPQPGALVCDIESVDAAEPLLMKLERGNPQDLNGTLEVMNHHDYSDGGSPFPYWPIPAQTAVHFRIGFRFAGYRPDPIAVCGDLFAAFARRYPVTKSIRSWTDRRPIAQVFFESDNTNGGLNPRKWFDGSQRVDTTTPAGVKRFQKMVFERAHAALDRMKAMNAQGVITWDIEGAQFPASTYMGDPSQLVTADPAQSVAPEMAEISDRYFKIFRDAGYRVGVTIRPQRVITQRYASGHVTNAWENDDDWDWKSSPPAGIQAFWQQQLAAKIRFARQRWGATLFYIDSNGDPGSPVSFLVMRNLAAEFPDVLLIPEQSTMGYYSATAPYRQLDMLSPANIVSPLIRETYAIPNGQSPCFSVINPTIESMTRCWPQLVQEIRDGDILFFRAWYDAPELPAIRAAYAAARRQERH
jgi:hypothetical protein